jgi:TPR repeat protein
MDRYSIVEGAKDLLNILSEEQFPETCFYLSSGIDAGFGEDTAYEIASMMVELDKPAPFPKEVVEYITALYETGIKEGDEDAMNDLGAQYYTGNRGFEQDFTRAVEYYHMAAEHGCRQAQENLGYCYYYGRNVEKDYEKAFHYFALGAFDGHLNSLYKIGDMYLNGYYVEKNEIEAFHIYMRCVMDMTDEAGPYVAGPIYLRAGRMFLKGLGTKPDAKKALKFFQMAEYHLYEMVRDGEVMYKKSMNAAIEGQEKARQKLAEELPSHEWTFE